MSQALVADVIQFSWVDGPGNRFALFLQGCNFDCKGCHNPQTIPLESIHARTVTPESMLDEIKRAVPHISGVTVSGGEATLQPRFVYELFAAIKADGSVVAWGSPTSGGDAGDHLGRGVDRAREVLLLFERA